MIAKVFHNWEYKLIALLLAVALYVYTSDLITIEKYIIIKNPSQNLEAVGYAPEHYVVTRVTPTADIELRVSGPRTIIEKMEKEIPLRLQLVEELIREGKQIFPVSNRLLGLDPSINIVSARPRDDIVVHVSRIKFKNISLDPNIIINDYPDSLMPAIIQLDKTGLEVSGAEDVINSLEFLPIDPLSFSTWNLKEEDVVLEMKQIVPVAVKPPHGVRLTDKGSVYATIIIKPKQSHIDKKLPVQIQAPVSFQEKYRVKLAKPIVVVTVHGPERLLKGLQKDQLIVYVKLDALMFSEGPTKKGVPVYVDGPSWLTPSPTTITVSAYLRDEKNTGANDAVDTPRDSQNPRDSQQNDPKNDSQNILPNGKKPIFPEE